jgi:hypothetical protein
MRGPHLADAECRVIGQAALAIQLCICRMLDTNLLVKVEGCVSTRKQLHMYYNAARMMPLPTTFMTGNLNAKILVMSFLQ